VNSPPPKPEVILTNFFAEPTVLLVPIITSRDIQIYSYGLLCEHVLSMRTVYKQYVVLGQKRNCQRVEETGL
jgi:hypothetical protein